MKAINTTTNELNAMNQIDAYEKVFDLAKDQGNTDLMEFAENQRQLWSEKLFGVKINWLY